MLLSAVGAWHLFIAARAQMQAFFQKPVASFVVGSAGVKHIACIMDGNRRWARARSLSPWDGHSKGVEPVKEVVTFCLDHKIPFLSLYAFSLENFKRGADELSHLFDIIEKGLSGKELQKLVQNGVRIRFIGDRKKFPARLIDTIKNIEKETATGKRLSVNILFCYGGQQEIVSACRTVARRVAMGSIQVADVTPKLIEGVLWSGESPAPDIVVRTGGEQRLSNCMPWQTAYSELIFYKTFWPAMKRKDFEAILVEYHRRKRNFGK